MDVIVKLFVVTIVGCAVALFDVLPLWRVGVAGALLAVVIVGVSMVQRTGARPTLAYHCATSIAVFAAISASMIGHPAFPQMTGMALVAAVASIAMRQWVHAPATNPEPPADDID